MYNIKVKINEQKMYVYQSGDLLKVYLISTATKGPGETFGSFQTPRGRHIIRAKIGANCPENTVFVKRRPTGEIFTEALKIQYPDRDWILTRIFWLSGLEIGKNRLGNVDTMRRFIYIHGAPDSAKMGLPGSKGCIRMDNLSIIELFDQVPTGTLISIE